MLCNEKTFSASIACDAMDLKKAGKQSVKLCVSCSGPQLVT